MAWLYQYLIAGCVIQVDSDSEACQQDMQKFLCLYQPVQGCQPDLRFSITKHQGNYTFSLMVQGVKQELWRSDDEAEVTAALEIHLYTQIIQYLDRQHIMSVHASAVNIQDKAIMFAGVSGAGKSSICTAALLDKAYYLSDEFALLDAQGFLHPFPRPMQWEHPEHPAFKRKDILDTGLIHADAFDFPAATGETVRCHLWHPRHIQRKPLPLCCIVLHQYKADLRETELVEIPRHEVLASLPQHLHIQHGLAKDLPRLNQRVPKRCRYYRLYFSNVKQAWLAIKKEVANV